MDGPRVELRWRRLISPGTVSRDCWPEWGRSHVGADLRAVEFAFSEQLVPFGASRYDGANPQVPIEIREHQGGMAQAAGGNRAFAELLSNAKDGEGSVPHVIGSSEIANAAPINRSFILLVLSLAPTVAAARSRLKWQHTTPREEIRDEGARHLSVS